MPNFIKKNIIRWFLKSVISLIRSSSDFRIVRSPEGVKVIRMSKIFFTVLTVFALCLTRPGTTWGAASKIEDAIIKTPGLYDIGTASKRGIDKINITVDGVALTGTNDNLSVIIGEGITLTLKSADITGTTSGSPIIASPDCTLILTRNNSARASGNKAGVNVPYMSSLTIMGPGKLLAVGAGGGAGIGGNARERGGNIRIKSAKIVARGGAGVQSFEGGGAGIGAGGNENILSSPSAEIEITNSFVQASGGKGSAFRYEGSYGRGGGGGAGIGGGGGGISGGTNIISGVSWTGITIMNSVIEAAGGDGGEGEGERNYTSGGGAGIGGGGGGAITAARNNGFGGDGKNIKICENSVVLAIGGDGGNTYYSSGGGGGGGAAVGGGGGGGSVGITPPGGKGGEAEGNTLGGQLASGSRGGNGAINNIQNTYSGGNGALCGNGGKGGYSSGEDDINGKPDTNCQKTGKFEADFTSRSSFPDPDLGYSVPRVTTNPSSWLVIEGVSVSFSVEASDGTGYLSYQWQFCTEGGDRWSNVPDGGIYSGATTAVLTLEEAKFEDNGTWFRCLVTDFVWRETISEAATLTVNKDETIDPPVEPDDPPVEPDDPPAEPDDPPVEPDDPPVEPDDPPVEPDDPPVEPDDPPVEPDDPPTGPDDPPVEPDDPPTGPDDPPVEPDDPPTEPDDPPSEPDDPPVEPDDPPVEPDDPPVITPKPPGEKPIPPDNDGVTGCNNTGAGPGMLILFAVLAVRAVYLRVRLVFGS